MVGVGVAPAAKSHSRDRHDLRVEEATIADIQTAILRRDVTTTEIVEDYLARIKAYNGTCVHEPEGLLGPISNEAATRHRTPPPDFGPLDSQGKPTHGTGPGKPRTMPPARRFRADELRAIEED